MLYFGSFSRLSVFLSCTFIDAISSMSNNNLLYTLPIHSVSIKVKKKKTNNIHTHSRQHSNLRAFSSVQRFILLVLSVTLYCSHRFAFNRIHNLTRAILCQFRFLQRELCSSLSLYAQSNTFCLLIFFY